jgi:hypothetical protein
MAARIDPNSFTSLEQLNLAWGGRGAQGRVVSAKINEFDPKFIMD